MQSSVFSSLNVTIINGTSVRGGAISIMQEAKLTVMSSKFTDCKSNVGAIVYSVNTLSVIKFTDIQIEKNEVSEVGFFYLLFTDIEINNMNFTNNIGYFFF